MHFKIKDAYIYPRVKIPLSFTAWRKRSYTDTKENEDIENKYGVKELSRAFSVVAVHLDTKESTRQCNAAVIFYPAVRQ
jgi:hypothetical protein